jgi:hypothetical protein
MILSPRSTSRFSNSDTGDWTLEALVAWLDRHIFSSGEARREITGGESAEFLRKVIRGLMAAFEIGDSGSIISGQSPASWMS